MITLIAAALVAATPVPSADADAQHQPQANPAQEQMDCCKDMQGDCKDCCKDMAAKHGAHESEHSDHAHQ